MKRLGIFLAAIVFVVIAGGFSNQACAQTRVALVIGNSAYEHAAPLKNSTDDAAAVSATLQRIGFNVNQLTDASYDKIRRALLEFGQAARSADIALVYFSGHSIAVSGQNWIIPVDAQLQYDLDVESEAFALRSIMVSVSTAKDIGIVLLEAGPENPFALKMRRSNPGRDFERGLASMEAGDNLVVAFAAKPGTMVVDREPHGAFTEALLKNFELPGLEINYLFRNVHDDVLEATNYAQEPAHYGSLSEREIYLIPPPARGEEAVPATEEIAWSFLQDSTDITLLRNFAEQFPATTYAAKARERIAALERTTLNPQPTRVTADEAAWTFLRDSSDISALRRFVALFPDSTHIAEARARITQLELPPLDAIHTTAGGAERPEPRIPRRVQKDNPNVENAWQLVKNTSDPHIVSKFASEYPSRKYVMGARARLAELGVEPWRPQRVRGMSERAAADYYVSQCDSLAGGAFRMLSTDGVDACRRAVAARPDIPRLHYHLCRCLIKARQPSEAAGYCESAVMLAKAHGDKSVNLYTATAGGLKPLVVTSFDSGIITQDASTTTAGGGGGTSTGGAGLAGVGTSSSSVGTTTGGGANFNGIDTNFTGSGTAAAATTPLSTFSAATGGAGLNTTTKTFERAMEELTHPGSVTGTITGTQKGPTIITGTRDGPPPKGGGSGSGSSAGTQKGPTIITGTRDGPPPKGGGSGSGSSAGTQKGPTTITGTQDGPPPKGGGSGSGSSAGTAKIEMKRSHEPIGSSKSGLSKVLIQTPHPPTANMHASLAIVRAPGWRSSSPNIRVQVPVRSPNVSVPVRSPNINVPVRSPNISVQVSVRPPTIPTINVPTPRIR